MKNKWQQFRTTDGDNTGLTVLFALVGRGGFGPFCEWVKYMWSTTNRMRRIASCSIVGLLGFLVGSCSTQRRDKVERVQMTDSISDARQAERRRMVETQLMARGITHPLVLNAMRRVPRHRCIPKAAQTYAYRDHPVPIGFKQTISQPLIVAFMTQASLSGMTAVTSISTTHSGRASAGTTSPVEHGCTPLSHLPIS